jgi:hypothetical protein
MSQPSESTASENEGQAVPQRPAGLPSMAGAANLPPVEPPSAGFIVQLFVIPAAIVGIIVLVWALFNWLAHTGSDPKAYVEAMKRDNESRWQAANNLADVLRGPGNEEVKRDVVLLSELRSLLDSEMTAGSMEDRPVTFRVYLCRAIGEFHLADAMPALVKAASTERDEREREVRLAALQGIARLIPNIPDSKPRDSRELREALLKATDDPSAVVRYHAAYTLGVLGGPEAIDRLKVMVGDLSSVDVRMNAATALARYGQPECVPELAKMVDPAETAGVDAEPKKELQKQKRLQILSNAFNAIKLFHEKAPTADVKPIIDGLDKLLASNPETDVRLAAEDLRRTLTVK